MNSTTVDVACFYLKIKSSFQLAVCLVEVGYDLDASKKVESLVCNYLPLYLLGFRTIDICHLVFNMKALLIRYPALLFFYLLSETCFLSWEKLFTLQRLMKCLLQETV